VPGTYTLVDHSLSRAIDKGAVAQIVVEGQANPEIFDVPPGQQMSAH
jgi:nitrite reductase (NO-forming)